MDGAFVSMDSHKFIESFLNLNAIQGEIFVVASGTMKRLDTNDVHTIRVERFDINSPKNWNKFVKYLHTGRLLGIDSHGMLYADSALLSKLGERKIKVIDNINNDVITHEAQFNEIENDDYMNFKNAVAEFMQELANEKKEPLAAETSSHSSALREAEVKPIKTERSRDHESFKQPPVSRPSAQDRQAKEREMQEKEHHKLAIAKEHEKEKEQLRKYKDRKRKVREQDKADMLAQVVKQDDIATRLGIAPKKAKPKENAER